ncbi:hypothetical protein L3X38_017137 [Prunus dulcis]|uniref:F-box domain-containing protein n=1 Tax=Prunus dulcis TaxID=3755 RepID=A0AAD4Z9S2_PRUDU|nr:hypothetical protein L3X38_017137 [Prunus dulcis]
MNRKRKPADNAIEIGNKEEHIQVMGSCIFDLPNSILYIVLLKLPTRSILICKCLCKTWQDLILDHEYAKLHFAQAESYPLARPSNPTRVSRTLYLVEPEDSSDFDFEHSNCTCYDASDFLFNECNGHQFHMNLAKYKIPLRNAEEVLNTHNDGNRKSGTKKKLCIKVCPAGHKYEVVNSCNGLLCLSKPFINDAVVVCNPITGEYIHLPEVLKLEYVKRSIDCGFGFSPKTNQYKVIRISEQGTLDSFRAAEYIKQRELEEACRVKKPFCEWLVTRLQAAGRDRSSFLFWWQEIGSGINIKWVLNAVSIVNLQKREGCTFFDRYHPKIYEPSKSLVLGLLKRLRKEEDENRRLSMEVRASSKGKWSSRACLVIHWMIVIVLLGMLLVEGGARAGLSKNVKLAL